MRRPSSPYVEILAAAVASGQDVSKYLRQALPYRWRDDYLHMSARPSDIVVFNYGTFDYVFDTFQNAGLHDLDDRAIPVEARLVAAIGTSRPTGTKRDDARLRGLTVSPMPGEAANWDRGHFIAHSIGGTVDGNEANVFLQLRSINRGRYRRMERYCQKNAGTMCFSRPIYADTSAHPSAVEFGLLLPEQQLWIEVMPNRTDA